MTYACFLRSFKKNPHCSSFDQKMRFLEIFNSIHVLIKIINQSMSAQIMIKSLELFMFGLLLIFSGSVAPIKNLPLFILTTSFVHCMIFQVSYIANSTKEEVRRLLILI